MISLCLWIVLAATSSAPNSAALFMESQLALMEGRLEEAESLARRSIQSDPGSLLLRTAYAEVLIQRGNIAKAREELQAVLAKDPDQSEALNLLSTLAAARRDWTQSEEYVRRA